MRLTGEGWHAGAVPARSIVLVVAATPPELAWVGAGGPVLACGVGPVEAAAVTAAALARSRPDAVLHVGIAGARAGVGEVVLGSESIYDDIAAAIPVERRLVPDAALLARARAALRHARVEPIATSAAVGRSATAAVEAMEGFGVLRAAALAGVPAIELRTISNLIGESDRARWDIPGALAALAVAGTAVLEALSA
jgi:futalosine hydrolase